MGYPDSLMVAYNWLDDLLGKSATGYNGSSAQMKETRN